MKTYTKNQFSTSFPENRERGKGLGVKNRHQRISGAASKNALLKGLLLLVFIFGGQFVYGQKTWDGGAGTSNWGDANNWNPNGAPGVGDAVTIANNNAPIVTVNITNAVCASLQLGGTSNNTRGTITFSASGSPKLTVAGAVTMGGSSNNANRAGTITLVSGSTLECGSLTLGNASNSPSVLTMSASSTLITGSLAVGGIGTTWTPSTGTVELKATNTLPATIFTSFNNLTISSGATTTGVALPTISGDLTVKAGATFALAHPVGATSGPTSVSLECGATGSTISGANTLTLGGNVTVTKIAGTGAGATISSPIALGATRTLTVADETTSANDLSISGVISGGFGIVKEGAGTMLLSGSSTYTGLTTINAGIIRLGAAGGGTNTPLGTTGAGTVVASGAALDLNGFTLGATEALTLNGTGLSSGGALTNSSATAATYSGLLTLGSASSIVSSAGNIVISNTGTITGGTFGITLGGTATGSSIASIIGTTSGTVTKIGTGTWTLLRANTYTGLTTVSAGILQAGVNDALATGGLTVNGGTYNIATFTDTIGAVTLTSGSIVGTSGILIGTSYAVESGSISAILAGTGALTKTTAGTVTLSGANTYSGTTSFAGGILQLGSAGVLPDASAVSLSGGTLSTGASTGFSEASGTLALTANSTIGLGTGIHNLNFAASNAIGWAGGATITITGWTGVGGTSGTAGKIYVGTNNTGLTAGQLAQLRFAGYPPGGEILPDGEIVPNGALPAVTSTTSANSTYGTASTYTITASNFPISFSATGLPTGMSINTTTGILSVAATTPAGTYSIDINATNLNGPSATTTLTYTVNPALLTITAGSQSVCFGTPAATVPSAGSYTPTGFVNSETASIIIGTVTFTTTYTASTPAGTVGVTITPIISGLTASNYTFSAASGTITVNAVPVAIPTSSFATQSKCINASPGFNPLTVEARSGFSYQWYRNTTGIASPGTDTQVGANLNSYTPLNDGSAPSPAYYYVVVSSPTSCGTAVTSAVSGAFTENPLPNVSFDSQPLVGNYCVDTDITYTTQAGESAYVWTIPGVLGLDYSVTPGTGNGFLTLTLKWLTPGSKSITVNYTDAQGCGATSAAISNTITVQKNTVTPSNVQALTSVCINTILPTTISHTATGAINIGTPIGLPAGITATWNNVTKEISLSSSGNPVTVTPGLYPYSIPLTGGCGLVSATGVLEITPVYALLTTTSVSPSFQTGSASVTVTENPASLPNGVYVITYSLALANTFPSESATVTISGGIGTFQTIGIPNEDITELTISSIRKVTDTCPKPITTNNTTYFGICSTIYIANGTFYVPAGVFSITIKSLGGGGKGANAGGGAGGGGGGYSVVTIPVTPGEALAVYVGNGGTNASPTGGTSYISRDSSIPLPQQLATAFAIANGGVGGTGTVSVAGGTGNTANGGSSSGSVGGSSGVGGAGAVAGQNAMSQGSGGGGGGGISLGNGANGRIIISFACVDKAPNDCIVYRSDGTRDAVTVIEFICSVPSWSPPEGLTLYEVLVVGGGGAGGRTHDSSSDQKAGGGGGGGEVSMITPFSIPAPGIPSGSSYSISVGAGGIGISTAVSDRNGKSSSFSNGTVTITSQGGGAGALTTDGNRDGISGTGNSSGGGGGTYRPTSGSGSTGVGANGPGIGNNGGEGFSAGNSTNHQGGGGGGSGEDGENAQGNNPGDGGLGLSRPSFTGITRFYGAGGGGGSRGDNSIGGSGFGGNGGNNAAGGNANPNSGSGGGGAGGNDNAGGNGGSGTVLIRYEIFRILPVEFLYFNATYNKEDRSGILIWATSKEWENSHFEIERAVGDTRTWTKVGEVAGAGYSDGPVEYSFTDSVLPAAGGNIFYRLKQVDFNEEFGYSVTRAIQVDAIEGTTSWIAYPNPSSNGSDIQVDLLDKSEFADGRIDVRISDARGVSYTYSVSNSDGVTDAVNSYLEKARPGLHILQIFWGDRSEVIKLIRN